MNGRQLICALAVVGALGTAQAASLDWSATQVTAEAGTTASLTSLGAESDWTTLSLAFVFTVGETQTGGPRLSVTTSVNTGAYLGVGVAGAKDQGRLYRDNTDKFYSRGTIHEGTNVVGMVIEVANNRLTLVSFDINGTTFGPAEVGQANGCYYSGLTGTMTIDSLTVALAENGTLYLAEGAATGEDFAALPEPTALALLALGVAGVALRRKVA